MENEFFVIWGGGELTSFRAVPVKPTPPDEMRKFIDSKYRGRRAVCRHPQERRLYGPSRRRSRARGDYRGHGCGLRADRNRRGALLKRRIAAGLSFLIRCFMLSSKTLVKSGFQRTFANPLRLHPPIHRCGQRAIGYSQGIPSQNVTRPMGTKVDPAYADQQNEQEEPARDPPLPPPTAPAPVPQD